MAYKKGDLIKFHRTGYFHWGVYVGNDHVVHLTGDAIGLSSSCCTSSLKSSGTHYLNASVKEEHIDVVANGRPHSCGNSKYDNNMTALEAEEICERARELIGDKEYNIIFNNCEHFATYCRYGKKKSAQVQAVVVVAAAVVVIAVAVLLGFSLMKKKSKKNTMKS